MPPASTEGSIALLPDTLPKLNALLKQINTHCKNCLAAENPQAALSALTSMIKLFPLDAFQEKGYLNQLAQGRSLEEISEIMELFLENSQMLFANIAALPQSERGFPDQVALMWILTAFMTCFSEMMSGKGLQMGLPDRIWDFNPYAVIVDKKMRLLLPECNEFMKNVAKKNNESICLYGIDSKPHFIWIVQEIFVIFKVSI